MNLKKIAFNLEKELLSDKIDYDDPEYNEDIFYAET